jgi:hypothetical protein
MSIENERTEYATNRARVDEQGEQRSLGTDLAQTFAQHAVGGAGAAAGALGVKALVEKVGDALKHDEPPSQVVLPPGVEKE